MIEQSIQTQAGGNSTLGGKGKAAKVAAGGLFGKLMAAFQKHLNQSQGADGQLVTGKTGKGKFIQSGEQAGIKLGIQKGKVFTGDELSFSSKEKHAAHLSHSKLKLNTLDASPKEKGLEKKVAKKDSVIGILQMTNDKTHKAKQAAHSLTDIQIKHMDAEQHAKDSVVGLGIVGAHQEDILPLTAKDEAIAKTQLSGKAKKQITDVVGKSKSLFNHQQKVALNKNTPVDMKKEPVSQHESVKVMNTPSKIGVSLQGVTGVDESIDASKLVVSGEKINSDKALPLRDSIAMSMPKSEQATNLNQHGGLHAELKSDVKLETHQSLDKPENKHDLGEGIIDKKTSSGEALSKAQTGFQPVTAHTFAHQSHLTPNHTQPPTGQTSAQVGAVLSDYAIQSSTNSQSGTPDHQENASRSAAEMIAMADTSSRDIRMPRNDFAMHMAYRSAHSFKPNDAMLEISRAARDGHTKLELTLEPATLGKIQVSLQTDATKQIQVHMLVDQAASRQVLEQQLPQLRQALADQGLNLSGFSMNMHSQQQEQQHSSQAFANQIAHVEGTGVGMDLDSPMQLGMNIAKHGRLNILA